MNALRLYLRAFTVFSPPVRSFLFGTFVLGLSGSVNWLVLNFYLEALGHDQRFIGLVNSLPAATVLVLGVPVFIDYCMEQVPGGSRALFMSLHVMAWNGAWAVGSNFSGHVQTGLGFAPAFHLLFGAMTSLYVLAIVLFWRWFAVAPRPAEIPSSRSGTAVSAPPAASSDHSPE
jgi:hypothetical protein